jgi:hypothetical protein
VTDSSEDLCPVCGKGTLRQVDFGEQQPDSHEVQTFTCGHEVEGARLDTSDADRLTVERRTSDETVMPVEPDE